MTQSFTHQSVEDLALKAPVLIPDTVTCRDNVRTGVQPDIQKLVANQSLRLMYTATVWQEMTDLLSPDPRIAAEFWERNAETEWGKTRKVPKAPFHESYIEQKMFKDLGMHDPKQVKYSVNTDRHAFDPSIPLTGIYHIPGQSLCHC